MNHDTLEIGNGYRVNIFADEHSGNPLEDWDREPPLLVFALGNRGGADTFGDFPTIDELVALVPESLWKRGTRVDTLERLGITAEEFRFLDTDLTVPDRTVEILEERYQGANTWNELEEYADTLSTLCDLADIPHERGKRYGYCQGDIISGICIATPKWREKVGAPEGCISQCENTLDTYGWWAFGDTYGFEVVTPEGETLPGCWGFCGPDHDASGLLDEAKASTKHHREEAQRQRRQRANVALFGKTSRTPVAV